jgi:hypothetical protein
MTTLLDIRQIIKPLNCPFNNTFSKDLDHILENIIIRDNMMYNSYVFNHMIYNLSYDELKEQIIGIIKKHLSSNIKNQRMHFRDLKKKNQLNVTNFTFYFDKMYKLISKLSGMFQHIIPTTQHKNRKWGDNIIWRIFTELIFNILIIDINLKFAITTTIKNQNDTDDDNIIFKLNIYIKNYSYYTDTPNENYKIFVDMLDDILIETIEYNILDVNDNMNDVFKFNKLQKEYLNNYYKYKYITKEIGFSHFKDAIIKQLNLIFSKNNIDFINNFLETYINELDKLSSHIDIKMIIFSCTPTDIKSFISYYYNLYTITLNKSIAPIIIDCIKENINKYIKTIDDITYLADIINTLIIRKKINKFYYFLGAHVCNIDEFAAIISQNLMERIIYNTTHYDYTFYDYEFQNYVNNMSILTTKYKGLFHKYNVILNDLFDSYGFNRDFNNEYIDTNFLITSIDSWKINHSCGNSPNIINKEEFTTYLSHLLLKYNNFPNNSTINKKLILYPHIGSVNITIGDSELIVLPAHMFCLEHFQTIETLINYDVLFEAVKENMINYKDEFIKSIIDSLIIAKILILKNNEVRLSVRIDKKPNVINMIEIFNNIHQSHQIIKKEIIKEIAHDRNDVIMTNINHYIKIKSYEKSELFNIIKDNIKVFELNEELFDKSLKCMLDKDYINMEGNNILKITY